MITFSDQNNTQARKYKNAEYSQDIKDCMSSALSQFVLTYDIKNKDSISKLSSFCDLVSFSIEAQMISKVCGLTPTVTDDFMEEIFEGEDIRYLHYPEIIKTSIMHAIRLFLIINEDNKDVILDNLGITLDQIEELADNVAYYIQLSVSRNDRARRT